jgi:MoaA/NifB/PqqE/SkfB family radical SAM enzyme
MMTKALEQIGFYTLCDNRACNVSATSPMWRCELIITPECNFNCPYCRGLREDCREVISLEKAIKIIDWWADDGLKHIRLSGGEPTTHPDLAKMIAHAKSRGIERIAISTNGSAEMDVYKDLVEKGVNDFSISLDACCASFADRMAGVGKQFERIVTSIRELSKLTYVTVGVVITEDTVKTLVDIVKFADSLGVADIRIISAAQFNAVLDAAKDIPQDILDRHPILKYRVNNILNGRNVRGLTDEDSHTCHLLYDDSVIAGNYHFPCVIYMRENGDAISEIGPNMRQERIEWMKNHDAFEDEICRKNCLDVCISYNNKFEELRR